MTSPIIAANQIELFTRSIVIRTSDCMSQMFSAAQRTSIYFEYIHFLP